MQILAVDLGTDLVPALALGGEPPEPGLMDRPPRRRSDHLIDRALLVRSYLWLGPAQAAAVMMAFYLRYWTAGYSGAWLDLPGDGALYASATGVALAAVVFTQIGNLLAHRTDRVSLLRIGLHGNRLLWWGIGSELVIIALIVYAPPLQAAIGTAAFPPWTWLALAALTPLLLVIDEVRKALVRRRAHSPEVLHLAGTAVTVVDVDPSAFERLGPAFGGTTVRGSGLDRDVLLSAGAPHAAALAAVTGDDDVNAVVARAARTELGVPRVVARLYDPAKAEAYDKLGVRTVCPVAWGTRRIGELLTATDVTPIESLGTGDVDLVECRVPALLAGRPLSELSVPGEIEPVALTRHGRTRLANPRDRLEVGDLVHLVVAALSMDGLEVLLGHREGRL
jgi:Trk K+ transport system NAD-binding subunit